MAPFIVRLADDNDRDVISDLYRRSSLSNDGDREVLLANPDALDFDDASIRERRTRVAVDGGRVVGFATTRVAGTTAELDDLFVDPDWMRRGVARQLILDAMTTLEAAGVTRIEVTANSHALEFYDAVGFVVDGTTETRFTVGTRMHLEI